MSGKKKYTDEFKLQLVHEYFDGRSGGLDTIAAKHEVSRSPLRRWINLFKAGGEQQLISVRRTYDGNFKIHVVEYMHQNYLSLNQAAANFGIQSPPTVAKWERIYYEEGKEALFEERRGRSNKLSAAKKGRPPKKDVNEDEDLLAEVQRLRMENEVLKKLIALTQKQEEAERQTE